MLEARPELINLCMAEDDERRALHVAVVERRAEMVRLLMEHGADAHIGVWPHRDATSARVMARERGDAEMSAILLQEEARRLPAGASAAPPPRSPADIAATATAAAPGDRSVESAARSAIVAGDGAWLRARHAEGALSGARGLLTLAIESDRPEILGLLLDCGFDPDDPGQVGGLDEVVRTFGEPLRACALAGQTAMAERLLQHGANPNTNVYAASSALFIAHERQDAVMIALLEQHGARLDPVAVGALGLVDRAATLLAEAAAAPAVEEGQAAESSVAGGLMWGAIERPSPAIVRMALSHVDWPRGDARWHSILQNGFYPSAEDNPAAHLEGLRLVLDRADPNLTSRHGATLLHYVAASHGPRTARDRATFATMLLDAGARLDCRDDLLQSTPLGWACRWGRIELVRLFLERGADPREPLAEPWATPTAWAEKMGRNDVLDLLRAHRPIAD